MTGSGPPPARWWPCSARPRRASRRWPAGGGRRRPGDVLRPVELVSVDSMAVYRGMDIGTAKPTPDEQDGHRYHLIDLVDASEEFTVQQFQAAGRLALAGIADRGHGALLVGGTGLYLRSLVDDLAFPGRYPEVACLARALASTPPAPKGATAQGRALADLHHRLAGSTRWPPAASSPPTADAWCGPSRSPWEPGRPFSSSARGSSATRRPRCRWSGSPSIRPTSTGASPSGSNG